MFAKVTRETFVNIREGKKTLIFVYFAGHAAMLKDTYIVLNDKNSIYPVERMIRGIAALKDTVVFGLFQCGKLIILSDEHKDDEREVDKEVQSLRRIAEKSFNSETDHRYMLAYKAWDDQAENANKEL